MSDAISELLRILKEGKVLKEDLQGLEALRRLKLVKIGRKYVRPRDYLEILGIDEIDKSWIPYVFKLATRLERGKWLKDPVLYSQGVFGLKALKSLKGTGDLEAVKVVAQTFAPDQIPPALINEFLLAIPTSCSFRQEEIDLEPLEAFNEFIRSGNISEALWEVPKIHGRLYDRLIEYIKYLQSIVERLKEVRKPRSETILAAIEKKNRTRVDRIRSLLRACSMLECAAKNLD